MLEWWRPLALTWLSILTLRLPSCANLTDLTSLNSFHHGQMMCRLNSQYCKLNEMGFGKGDRGLVSAQKLVITILEKQNKAINIQATQAFLGSTKIAKMFSASMPTVTQVPRRLLCAGHSARQWGCRRRRNSPVFPRLTVLWGQWPSTESLAVTAPGHRSAFCPSTYLQNPRLSNSVGARRDRPDYLRPWVSFKYVFLTLFVYRMK